ncbi:facilitated glucose transporter protein 1-like isoform X2 [Rhodnius prolixus]|uniref:facilitated glucose transporter protein 1-like isoform X2 n=1 Tax=Rhodnius prolixus TaxID=13249 RepID=UPI003D18CC63
MENELSVCTRKSDGLNIRLVFAVVTAAFGSAFQHGYNIGVVNAPGTILEEWIYSIKGNQSAEEISREYVALIWSTTVSIFCIGGMIGGTLVGPIADQIGRKNGLIYNNIIAAIGALFQGFAKQIGSCEVFIFGRFIIGLNAGINAGLAPVYLTEISPVALRGAVGTVYQFVITISILLSQILGLQSMLGTEDRWPYLFLFLLVPALIQTITLPFCPESPKQMLKVTRNEIKAKQALIWLRGSLDVHAEFEEMKGELESERNQPTVSLSQLLINRRLRTPLLISSCLMLAQQFSGINIITYYSTMLFLRAGLTENTAQYATLGVSCVNVLMTLISLILVEKSGRKTLLLIGFGGMFVSTILLSRCLAYVEMVFLAYLSIAAVVLFVAFFSIGPGAIPWFITTELFAHNARPTATSVAVCINWMANFMVGISFLPLTMLWRHNALMVFAFLQALSLLFIHYLVPETKNKTIEEISTLFR